MIALTAALILGPYLDAREVGAIGGRVIFDFVSREQLLPKGSLFLGWRALSLALVGIFVPRSTWCRRRLPATRVGHSALAL